MTSRHGSEDLEFAIHRPATPNRKAESCFQRFQPDDPQSSHLPARFKCRTGLHHWPSCWVLRWRIRLRRPPTNLQTRVVLGRRQQRAAVYKRERGMTSRLITAVCAVVLCVILTLGLWPFHVPRNEVSWLGNRNGLRFGRYGTVFSAGEFRLQRIPQGPESGSLEVWLQPARIWDFSTFLTFYLPGRPLQFSLRQAQTSLLLEAAIQGDRRSMRMTKVYLEDAFPKTGPAFITVTTGRLGTNVYLDGVIAKRAPQMVLPARAFSGRLVLGDSAGQADSWSGQLLGVSIYSRELSPTQVLQHYEAWKGAGQPQIAVDEGNVALFPFDERSGRTINSKGGSGSDLDIPQKHNRPRPNSLWRVRPAKSDGPKALEAPILKNIVGFVPFGFCFYTYFFFVRQAKRAALATVTLGFTVSVTIEVLQAFLPTRDSGITDIVTNTCGTWIGVLVYKAVRPILGHWLP